jgi:GNAT superfamily N-acetyltransferase
MCTVSYRMMRHEDVGIIPTDCMGEVDAIHARIDELGSCAVLGFDGDQHVAQLQFRRYRPDARSSNSIWDPAYWGDFGASAPNLPEVSLSLHCFHVGQTSEGEARQVRYQGRGIGGQLLAYLLKWAKKTRFRAVIAKAAPPVPSIQNFMGGQSGEFFASRRFNKISEWKEDDLAIAIKNRGLLPPEIPMSVGCLVSCWVLHLDVDR